MKTVLLPLMLLLIVCVFCACGKNKTRLDEVGDDGYNVSVRFEANGGEFSTNCYSIVDSYNISNLKTNASDMVELALISPDNPVRGANDTFTVQKAGFFLAGWYERVETVDSEGNTTYTYTNKWNFESGKLAVDPNKTYNVNEPVITLYAVWVPQFEINFINKDTGEQIKNLVIAPEETEMNLPHFDEKTGKMKMYKFPELSDATFSAAYIKDASGAYVKVDGKTLMHHGEVDANGNAVNPVMDVYVEYIAGKHYQIYTAQQLADNASSSGIYHIMADLDFTDVTWPSTFCITNNKEFNGQIIGNGRTISNITMKQSSMDDKFMGLFAKVGADAQIKDVTFENVTLQILKGTKQPGCFGLFAGENKNGAVIENVTINNATVQIANRIQLAGTFIGLVVGDGSIDGITWTIENAETGEITQNIVVIEIDSTGNPVAAGSESYEFVVDASGQITISPIEDNQGE